MAKALDLDLDKTLNPVATLLLLYPGKDPLALVAHRLHQEGTLAAHREVVSLMGDVLAATERAATDAGGAAWALHRAMDILHDALDWHLGDVEAALKGEGTGGR